MTKLSSQELERYSRQMGLDEIGDAGQKKLKQSRVLVIGAGGLSSPVSLYLAAAGVGTLGLADPDGVDLSNLNRQILHSTQDLGRPKVVSAEEKIRALNPHTEVALHKILADKNSISSLMKPYDFVVDATDNFASKFLINDAAFALKKPFSHAGVMGFSGQTMTVSPGKTACLRCLFPHPPEDPEKVFVLGTSPGLLGAIQAAETIKYLLSIGDLLTNALLVMDTLKMSFKRMKIKKNPKCSLCG